MAWTKTTENGRLVAKETLSQIEGSADLAGSIIDFVPPGKDFTVIANLDATDLSSEADIAIHMAAKTTDTFTLIKDDLIATIDGVVQAGFYDTSANGDAPYYKCVIDSAGTQAYGATVTIAVIVE